ncbi:MAG: hypothetical protein R2819_11215 [Allomuricauda sp.]
MYRIVILISFCLPVLGLAQANPIKIVEEPLNNRIAFYAVNETYKDYDVLFDVKGSNFRQSAVKPRLIRVPATSKVHLKTIILFRDKKPVYTKSLQVSDSLSPRALKKEFEILDIPPPKITPKRQITIYTTNDCATCDSIVTKLTAENYIFRNVVLSEAPEVKDQLGTFLAKSPEEMDTISQPIVSLGGKLYDWILSYDQLMEELDRE